MFVIEIVGFMVLAAVVLMVVQAEVYAMLHAVAFARKWDGSLAQKLLVGGKRYEWASVIWHETTRVQPAYSVIYTMVVWFGTFLAVGTAMEYGALPFDAALAASVSVLAATGFFGVAYGEAFGAHREKIAAEQFAGTWKTV